MLLALNPIKVSPWIVDFGASDHMTGSSHLFSSYTPCPSNLTVRIADDSLSTIAGKGTIRLSKTLILTSVLHVPNVSHNLPLVSKITKDQTYVAKFSKCGCEFQDLSGRRLECEGVRRVVLLGR